MIFRAFSGQGKSLPENGETNKTFTVRPHYRQKVRYLRQPVQQRDPSHMDIDQFQHILSSTRQKQENKDLRKRIAIDKNIGIGNCRSKLT